MTLLDSLQASNEYLITALEIMPMKELTMNYVTTVLMHKTSKCNMKDSQRNDVAMVLRQSKAATSFHAKAQSHISIVVN